MFPTDPATTVHTTHPTQQAAAIPATSQPLQALAVALRDLLQSDPSIDILEDATDEACPWLSFQSPSLYAVASFTPDGFTLTDDRMRPYASWSIKDHSADRVPARFPLALH